MGMIDGAGRRSGGMLAALAALLGLFVLIVAPTVHGAPASPAAPAAEACADLMEADCGLHADLSRTGLHVQHGSGCHPASACAAALLPSQGAPSTSAGRMAPAEPSVAAFWSDRVRDPMLRPPIRRT
jgi:hypothetical protein